MKINRSVLKWLRKREDYKPNFCLLSLGNAYYGLKAPMYLQVRDVDGRGTWVYSDLLDMEVYQPTEDEAVNYFCKALIGAHRALSHKPMVTVPDRHAMIAAWIPLLVDNINQLVIARA